MAPEPDLTAAFAGLGFTGVETAVYAALLRQPGCTAYALARRIGRPVANTYQAVASLQAKGAVAVDDGDARSCRAVPVARLLAARRREFRRHERAARAALAALPDAGADDRVWRLGDVDAVLECARDLLRGARQVVLADLFPGPFAELRAGLLAATARGVRVVVKRYDAVPVRGLESVHPRDPELALRAWPGQQLSLVADAREHLLALLGADLRAVHQAVHSTSDFLSCLHHNHLANELCLTAAGGVHRGARGRPLAPLSLLTADPPGLRALRRRLAGRRPARESTIA